MIKKVLNILGVFLLVTNSALGANILFVAVDPAPSHMNSFKPIINQVDIVLTKVFKGLILLFLATK
jgi:uncharacterized membrane protein YwaF